MSEVFDISFACPFFLPVQSFSCFSPIFSLALLSLVVFVIVFSSLIWLIVYICGLPFILSLSAVARHDAWSQIVISIILCFAISHHVYESIFNWLALPSGCCCCCRMAALLLPPPSLLSVFFLLFHSKTNRKIKFNLLEMLWKRSQMRVHKSETNEWKETQRCKPTRQ